MMVILDRGFSGLLPEFLEGERRSVCFTVFWLGSACAQFISLRPDPRYGVWYEGSIVIRLEAPSLPATAPPPLFRPLSLSF